MPDIKWIKINTEMFDDEKIRIIEAMPEADTLIVIWIRLICMAGKVNAGGHIYLSPELPYDEEQLAAVFNRPLNTVRLALETFRRLQMIEMTESGDLFLPKFEKHQNIEGMEKIRVQGRERQATFRERRKVTQLPAVTQTKNGSNSEEPEKFKKAHAQKDKEKTTDLSNTGEIRANSEESLVDYARNNGVTLRNATVTQQNRIEKNRKEERREEEIWNNILLKLKGSINKHNFRTWLADSKCLEIKDSEIVVGVAQEEIARYIETNMVSLVEKCVAEVTELPLKLRVVLIEP